MRVLRNFITFTSKELFELKRSGRLLLFGIIFVLFGIMNPAMAKLTPWLLQTMADSLEATGITLSEYTVTAMDSWVQFFKNMPMAMLVVLVMFGGIFTSEYAKGTLIPLLAKGLPRTSIIAAKTFSMLLVWSGGYWLAFLITLFYSDYYWDNSTVSHYTFAAFGLWLFGIMLLCAITFFSSFANSAAQVLLGVGTVYAALYLIGMIGGVREYLPSYLTESAPLLSGQTQPSEYFRAVWVTAAASAAMLAASVPITAKRRL